MAMSAEPGAKVEILTCRARRRGARCDAVVGSVTRAVIPTQRILPDVRQVADNCVAAWCKRCQAATEYRYLSDPTPVFV